MPIPEPSPCPSQARATARDATSRGQHDLADKSFPEKSISYAYRCQRNVSAADSLSQKSPELPGACMQFARNNHICGGVYGIKDSQLGDGPMNLALELQRRLDRRWSARFRMSEKRSRPAPCAAMARTVVKAQAPAVRAGQPVLEYSAPASCSTRRLVI